MNNILGVFALSLASVCAVPALAVAQSDVRPTDALLKELSIGPESGLHFRVRCSSHGT